MRTDGQRDSQKKKLGEFPDHANAPKKASLFMISLFSYSWIPHIFLPCRAPEDTLHVFHFQLPTTDHTLILSEPPPKDKKGKRCYDIHVTLGQN